MVGSKVFSRGSWELGLRISCLRFGVDPRSADLSVYQHGLGNIFGEENCHIIFREGDCYSSLNVDGICSETNGGSNRRAETLGRALYVALNVPATAFR